MNKPSIKPITLEEALLTFRHAMTSAILEEAKKQDCSLTHFEVLKFIGEKGSPTMKDIAARLLITPPSASALIDALVAKQLVIRNLTPEDRRTVRVILAPGAHVLLSSIYQKKDSIFKNMLSKLDKDDKDELARILIKCI